MAPSKGEDEDKVFRPLKEEWLKEHKYTQLMGKIRDWVNAFVGKMNEKDEEQTAEVGCEGMKEGGTEQMTEDEVGVCNFVLKNLLKIKKTNKGKKQRKKVDIEMEEYVYCAVVKMWSFLYLSKHCDKRGFIDNVFGILRELGTTLSGGVQHKQCDYNYVLEHMKVLGQPMLQHIWSAIESKREVMTLINANPTENPANSATSRGPEDGEGDIIVRIDANPGISVKYAPSNGQRTNEEAVVLHFGPGGLSTDREDNLIPGSTTIKGPQNPLSTLLKTTVSKTNKKKANYKCPNRKSVEGGYYADENDDGKELSITGWFTRFSEDVTQEDDKKNNREVDTVLYLCEDLDGIPIDDMEKYKGFCRIMVKNIILTTGVPKQYKNEDGEMPCEKKVKNIPVCDLLKVWMYYMRIFCAPKDVIEKILDAVKPVMEKLIYGDGNYAECSYDDALKIPYTGQKNVVDEVYELFDTNILYNKMKETTSKKTWCTKAREGVSPALSDLVEDNRVVAGNGDTKKFNEIVQQVDNILVHEEEEEEKEKKLDVLKENINEHDQQLQEDSYILNLLLMQKPMRVIVLLQNQLSKEVKPAQGEK
ncbi:SICA antigen [Plasmodium coatneyi]|uniref:SICA antigen n=1 Tax=Plasmodium coatneyi TaxID=208452 RepID=A0A1B1E0G7_9APIC|nr:SICA antigen [Plasmodium coatneyi]ANQ08349.1 SICA antigen [Plasmodium coatneyi]